MRARERVPYSNAQLRTKLGIADVQWHENRGTIAVWFVMLQSKELLVVEVPSRGTTESSVLKKAAEMLKDRPVRYA